MRRKAAAAKSACGSIGAQRALLTAVDALVSGDFSQIAACQVIGILLDPPLTVPGQATSSR